MTIVILGNICDTWRKSKASQLQHTKAGVHVTWWTSAKKKKVSLKGKRGTKFKLLMLSERNIRDGFRRLVSSRDIFVDMQSNPLTRTTIRSNLESRIGSEVKGKKLMNIWRTAFFLLESTDILQVSWSQHSSQKWSFGKSEYSHISVVY